MIQKRPAFCSLNLPILSSAPASALLLPPLEMLSLQDFAWLALTHHPSLRLNVTSSKKFFTTPPKRVCGSSLVIFSS